MRYDNEGWCKIWNRINLPFRNSREQFNTLWPGHSKISTIFTLMGWFWPNYLMFQLKKYRRVMFDCTQDWYKVWRKTGLCFQKLIWGIWQIFTRAHESLQTGILMASFCPKLEMHDLRTYRGVICHQNEEWCKNWRGIDLSVQNWREQFDKFWPKHSNISKLFTLIGCLWRR